MKLTVQKKDRKALFILAVAVAAFFTVSKVVLPFYDSIASAEGAARDKEDLLKKYRQVAARKGNYAALLDQIKKQTTVAEDKLIRAASTSLASVEFQALVEAVLQRTGINVTQRNVAAGPQTKDSIGELSMNLVFEAKPQQLIALLAEMRALPKAVRVSSLNVVPLQVAHEAPMNGQLVKDWRVTMTLAALVGNTSEGVKK